MEEKQLSKLRLEKIGFVFQFYNLVQNLSVEDNILLPMSVNSWKFLCTSLCLPMILILLYNTSS